MSQLLGDGGMDIRANLAQLFIRSQPLGEVDIVVDPDDLKNPAQNELLRRWHALATSGLPRRKDLDPTSLAPIAAWLALFDMSGRTGDGGADFRVRFLGTGLVEVFGEHTGRTISEVPPGGYRDRALHLARMTCERRRPIFAFAQAVAVEGKTYLQSHSLYLPLTQDGGPPAFVLAMLQFNVRGDV